MTDKSVKIRDIMVTLYSKGVDGPSLKRILAKDSSKPDNDERKSAFESLLKSKGLKNLNEAKWSSILFYSSTEIDNAMLAIQNLVPNWVQGGRKVSELSLPIVKLMTPRDQAILAKCLLQPLSVALTDKVPKDFDTIARIEASVNVNVIFTLRGAYNPQGNAVEQDIKVHSASLLKSAADIIKSPANKENRLKILATPTRVGFDKSTSFENYEDNIFEMWVDSVVNTTQGTPVSVLQNRRNLVALAIYLVLKPNKKIKKGALPTGVPKRQNALVTLSGDEVQSTLMEIIGFKWCPAEAVMKDAPTWIAKFAFAARCKYTAEDGEEKTMTIPMSKVFEFAVKGAIATRLNWSAVPKDTKPWNTSEMKEIEGTSIPSIYPWAVFFREKRAGKTGKVIEDANIKANFRILNILARDVRFLSSSENAFDNWSNERAKKRAEKEGSSDASSSASSANTNEDATKGW